MSALLGMQINQVMLFVGVGLFVFVMINRLRRGFSKSGGGGYNARTWQNDRRPGQPVKSPRDVIGSARLRSASALPDHESWEVELHRLAREIKGEIDTKMRALAELIQRGEDVRSRLEDSIGRAESLGLSDRSVKFAEALPVSRSAERPRNTKSNRERARSPQTAVGDEPGEDPRFERVYALADAGFSAAKIAGQIGSQVGEVELILSLRHANPLGMLVDSEVDESRPRAA